MSRASSRHLESTSQGDAMTTSELTLSEAAPRRLPPSEIDCKWWKQGYCFHGSDCYFRHDPKLIGVDNRTYEANREHGEQEERKDGDVNESNQDQCVICLQTPSTFGLLLNCNHVFCLGCIRNWRASAKPTEPCDDFDPIDNGAQLKKACKTCPVCRTYSDFIIPSSVLPESTLKPSASAGSSSGVKKGEPKQEIINGYLGRLKTIPCRYFEDSIRCQQELPTFNPVCRFGNNCHYAHIDPNTRQPYIFSPAELNAMKPKRRVKRRAQQLLEQVMTEEILLLGLESLQLESPSDQEYSYDSELSF